MGYYSIPNPDKVPQSVVLDDRAKSAIPARIIEVTSHTDGNDQPTVLFRFVATEQGDSVIDPFKAGRPTARMFDYTHVARVFVSDHESMSNLRQLSNELNGGQRQGLSHLTGFIVGIVPDDSDFYVEAICPIRKRTLR